MVTIKLVSDIHLKVATPWQNIFKDNSTYLILAGDICKLDNMEVIVNFINSICIETSFNHIYFICGNHEYYNYAGYTFDGLLAVFREKTRSLANFTILNNQSIDIENNLRLFGGTMWSYIPTGSENLVDQPIYDEYMNSITSNWYNCEHYRFLRQLDIEIQNAEDDHKRLLVVTHHSPTFNGTLKDRHYDSPRRFLYCSELDRYLSKTKVYTWMYGHTHVNTDYLTTGGTRIVSNQYAADNYDPNKVIRIKDVISNDTSSNF